MPVSESLEEQTLRLALPAGRRVNSTHYALTSHTPASVPFASSSAALDKDQPLVGVVKRIERAVVVADHQAALDSRVIFIA